MDQWEQAFCCRDSVGKTFLRTFLLSLVLLLIAFPAASHAIVTTAITSDVTLGTTLNGGVFCASSCTITGGTRPSNVPNLFHSFGQFNLGTGDTANFFDDTGAFTANILSRVTGGNP